MPTMKDVMSHAPTTEVALAAEGVAADSVGVPAVAAVVQADRVLEDRARAVPGLEAPAEAVALDPAVLADPDAAISVARRAAHDQADRVARVHRPAAAKWPG